VQQMRLLVTEYQGCLWTGHYGHWLRCVHTRTDCNQLAQHHVAVCACVLCCVCLLTSVRSYQVSPSLCRKKQELMQYHDYTVDMSYLFEMDGVRDLVNMSALPPELQRI
jgi:hypothetical protein